MTCTEVHTGATRRATPVDTTRRWIKDVVIGRGLCPFAGKLFDDDSIVYTVLSGDNTEIHLRRLVDNLIALQDDPHTSTGILIFPDAYEDFEHYLALLEAAETLISDMAIDDIFQLASFHPRYRFEGADSDDAANFTNRSPFPMLHIIRQKDVSEARANFPDIEKVPERNIASLRSIGTEALQAALDNLISNDSTEEQD